MQPSLGPWRSSTAFPASTRCQLFESLMHGAQVSDIRDWLMERKLDEICIYPSSRMYAGERCPR